VEFEQIAESGRDGEDAPAKREQWDPGRGTALCSFHDLRMVFLSARQNIAERFPEVILALCRRGGFCSLPGTV